MYLGSTITQDGKVQSAIKEHCDAKAKHGLKFQSFVAKNNDFPFCIKRQVLDAALLSSIFYGCEAWLCKQLRDPKRLYMPAIKALLGVRATTPNDQCLVDLGYPTVQGYIRQAQFKFYNKLIAEREGLPDDPFSLVWSMARVAKTQSAKYIQELLKCENPKDVDLQRLKGQLSRSKRTKDLNYCKDINPNLEPHPVYKSTVPTVPEYQRLAFSRLRLSAHNLAIETGRWTRTPREQRLCACGQMQTESHVISACPITAAIRAHHSNITNYQLPSFFDEDPVDICAICYKCVMSY